MPAFDAETEPLKGLIRQALAIEPALGDLDVDGLFGQPGMAALTQPARLAERILSQVLVIPQRLLLIHAMVLGGAERVAAHAAEAVAAHYGTDGLLILATDGPERSAAHWFLPHAPVVVLADCWEEPLNQSDLAICLVHLMLAWRPRAVLNVNSAAGWLAFERYAPALTVHTRWSAAVFCRDRLPNGRPHGHVDRFLRHCLPWLEALLSDHRGFLDQWARDTRLPSHLRQRLKPVYQPVSCADHVWQGAGQRCVLWAGRLCAQKQPDLLSAVAQLCPDLQFHVYGPIVSAELWCQWGLDLPNVQHKGVYQHFSELNVDQYGALLFTSAYEGLPNVLLEAAGAGLPIVASSVGGVPELVNHRAGWPVAMLIGAAQAMASCLREAIDNPQTARARAKRAQQMVRNRHNQKRYWQQSLRGSSFFRKLDSRHS